jgi:hypothetical protein
MTKLNPWTGAPISDEAVFDVWIYDWRKAWILVGLCHAVTCKDTLAVHVSLDEVRHLRNRREIVDAMR